MIFLQYAGYPNTLCFVRHKRGIQFQIEAVGARFFQTTDANFLPYASKTYNESDLNEAWHHGWLKAIELSKARNHANNNVRNTWRYALGFAIEVMDLGCMSPELMDTAITPTG